MANREIRGIGFPFDRGSTSFPDTANGTNAIIARVKSLLTTGPGEVPMQPNQGSIVQKYVFENMTPLMRSYLSDEIRNQINTFIPQMNVVSVATEVKDNIVTTTVEYVLEGVAGNLEVEFGPDGG